MRRLVIARFGVHYPHEACWGTLLIMTQASTLVYLVVDPGKPVAILGERIRALDPWPAQSLLYKHPGDTVQRGHVEPG